MKKKICILLVVMSFCFSCVVYADTAKQRGLVEFCELYMQRITWLADSGIDCNINPLGSLFTPQPYINGLLSVPVTAGSAYINPDTFEIEMMRLDFIYLDESDEKNDEYYMSSAVALSALEFNYIDDNTYSLRSKIEDSPNSATEAAFDIFDKYLIPAVQNGALGIAMDTGELYWIYSGKYDYYIEYREVKDSGIFYLIAKTK